MQKIKSVDPGFRSQMYKLLIPLVIQNLLNAAVSSSDVVMLNYVSQSSISAVSLAANYAQVLGSVFYGLGTGATLMCAQYYGKKDFQWAVETATRKKGIDCSGAEFLTVDEALCVQCMHLGPYDDEPATVAKMDAWLAENGYRNDFSPARLHHEIYMSDARKVPSEKLKTVIRHPVRKI